MKKIVLLFFLLGLVILEATVLDYIRIFNVKPDLTLTAAVSLIFFYRSATVLAFGCLAGFFKDILSVGPLGLNTLLFVLIIFIISKLSKKLMIESLPLRMVIISFAVLLENIIAGFILPFYNSPIPLGIYFRSSIISAVYTAFVSPLIIKIIRYI